MKNQLAARMFALMTVFTPVATSADGGNDPIDNRPKTEITNDNNAVNIINGDNSDAYEASLNGKMSLFVMGGNADNLDAEEIARLLRDQFIADGGKLSAVVVDQSPESGALVFDNTFAKIYIDGVSQRALSPKEMWKAIPKIVHDQKQREAQYLTQGLD